MTKRKRTKEQITIYKTLHGKLKIEQKPDVNSGAPKAYAAPVPLVTLSCYNNYKPGGNSSIPSISTKPTVTSHIN